MGSFNERIGTANGIVPNPLAGFGFRAETRFVTALGGGFSKLVPRTGFFTSDNYARDQSKTANRNIVAADAVGKRVENGGKRLTGFFAG